MNVILNKRHILLAVLVVALGAAVYLNWRFAAAGENLVATGQNNETKYFGDAQYVDATGTEDVEVDAEQYFSEVRLTREQTRDEAIETISKLFEDTSLDDEQRAQLTVTATEIAQQIETEGRIESLIKAKGFEDCIVYLSDESANVVVRSEGLLSNEVAQIKDIILQESDVAVENIQIVERK